MLASSNSAAIMNSVGAGERGVASGMMATLMNSGFVLSMGMFFTIIVVELSRAFPPVLVLALAAANASPLISEMRAIPPTAALFAAFLGYNPVEMNIEGLSPSLVAEMAPATIATLTNMAWFPNTLAEAFAVSWPVVLYWRSLVVCSRSFVCNAGQQIHRRAR
jgi:hypothetical protein